MVVIQSLWKIMLASLIQIIYFLVDKVLSTPTLYLPWFRKLAVYGLALLSLLLGFCGARPLKGSLHMLQ